MIPRIGIELPQVQRRSPHGDGCGRVLDILAGSGDKVKSAYAVVVVEEVSWKGMYFAECGGRRGRRVQPRRGAWGFSLKTGPGSGGNQWQRVRELTELVVRMVSVGCWLMST